MFNYKILHANVPMAHTSKLQSIQNVTKNINAKDCTKITIKQKIFMQKCCLKLQNYYDNKCKSLTKTINNYTKSYTKVSQK